MMKIIRWQGLAVFVVLTAIIAVFWVLLVDRLVKSAIEAAGTRAVGARVELAAADLSLLPLGLDLVKLQVTNPDEPMRNVIEIDRIRLLFELNHLLKKKVVADEMTVENIRFNTPRKVSGAIKSAAEKKPEDRPAPTGIDFQLPRLNVADIEDILKKEKLQTVEAVKNFEEDIAREKQKLQAMLNDLPNEETFRRHKAKIDGLKKGGGSLGDVLGAASSAASLKQDVEKDLGRIKDAQKRLDTLVNEYENRLRQVSQMPMKDFERLKSKYSLSSTGLGNAAQLLLGPRYGTWVKTGLKWYDKARPHLQASADTKTPVTELKPARGDGMDVTFRENEPVPAVLIRQTRASVASDRGIVSGRVMDITSDQTITKRPTTYAFSGDKLQGLDRVRIEGQLIHFPQGTSIDTLQADIKGYQLADIALAEKSALPVTIKKAAADTRLEVELKNKTIRSRLSTGFNGVQFKGADTEQADPLAAALASALSGVDRFNVAAELSGTVDDYKVSIRSDLDKTLKNAVSGAVEKQAAVFENRLKSAIQKQTAAPLAQLNQQMSGFGNIEKEIDSRLNLGQGLLGNLKLF